MSLPPSELDLRFAVFETIREPGRRYTLLSIAEAVGCSKAYVLLLEQRAIAKMKRAARRKELGLS